MLKLPLLWGTFSTVLCYQWFAETIHVKTSLETFKILPTDNVTGCKVLYFPPDIVYFYSDSCVGVPSHYEFEATEILLRTTKISKIRAGDLDNWYFATWLALEMNTELEEIERGVFANWTELKNLSITNNYKLKPLDVDVFQGLVNLKEMAFINNNLKDLQRFLKCIRPDILPALKDLDLSQNPITYIKKQDFAHFEGSNLETLHFTLCNLITIDSEAFSTLSNLRSLYIGNNNLNSYTITELVIGINKTNTNLTELCLSANLLHKHPYQLLETIAKTNVKVLDLKENHFDPLVPGSFPFMPNLETLDLSGIAAVAVENGTLSEDVLPNLKKLILARNRLIGISTGIIQPNIEELDLSENTCDNCFTGSLFKIGDYEFQNMKSLKILNLSKNNMYHIRRYTFYNIPNLRALFLSNCTLYKIDVFSFENLTRLEHLDLSHNNFLMSYALNGNSFAGLENLISLRLDYCRITAFSDPDVFSQMTNLKYINLERNTLVEFHPTTFHPLVNAENIDLSYNDLLEWDTELFQINSNLTALYLVSNQISEMTVSMLKDFSGIEFVDISENPFYCTCTIVNVVKEYINKLNKDQSVNLSSLHLNDTRNVCFSPRTWGNTELIDFLQSNFVSAYCKENVLIYIVIVIASLLIVLLVACLVYYLRWHIRYWIFLLRQAMRFNYFPKRNNKECVGKYKYDAFVSYSHEDRSFVVRLVAMLESQEPFLSLCVFERDFNVGGVITDNVVECLSSSRRTILVLSDSFARSTWCLWEMQMAQHKWLFLKDGENEPLIIIKIGEIMDRHMTPTLRYLIRSRVYLQWNSDPKKQKIFWQKLRSALSKPTVI